MLEQCVCIEKKRENQHTGSEPQALEQAMLSHTARYLHCHQPAPCHHHLHPRGRPCVLTSFPTSTLYPPMNSSQHSTQGDPLKMCIRSGQTCAPNPVMELPSLGKKSQSLQWCTRHLLIQFSIMSTGFSWNSLEPPATGPLFYLLFLLRTGQS